MIPRVFRPCKFLVWIYPGALFRLKTEKKLLCLTFDDGPDPDTTPGLIDILNRHGLKAVFFCNGRSAEVYHSLVDKIKQGGHIVGNHGYDHLDGWKTGTDKYCKNAEIASAFTSGTLFRPPYGRLRLSQFRKLRKSYRIVFWDIISYDFDNAFGSRRSLEMLERKKRIGSVIVFHDTSSSSCLSFIEDFILKSVEQGYDFILP
ncbi:MAG: polysaccharide deacetylase family protein [Bacteroidales bacterium]|jgi:peptidoglycan/xylan/chitin deacetylase (PgdA/CDA1 family)